jgi:NitT/TauT family transport system ATP-binding protein
MVANVGDSELLRVPTDPRLNRQHASRSKIEIRDLSVSFGKAREGGTSVLRGLDFSVAEGEFVCLLGPSGCGKSTLLNFIAGFLDKECTSFSQFDMHWRTEGRRRPLGFVFQQNALAPWMTLAQNVELGLRIRKVSKAERQVRAASLIARVGLSGFEDVYPHQLSGGMLQRANIIRALAYDPEVILMDEPFSAVDSQTRSGLQAQVLELWRESKKTIIFVTHDLNESILLGQRILLFGPRGQGIVNTYDVSLTKHEDMMETTLSPEFVDLGRRIWADFHRISGD